jgi:hypothetical protein
MKDDQHMPRRNRKTPLSAQELMLKEAMAGRRECKARPSL